MPLFLFFFLGYPTHVKISLRGIGMSGASSPDHSWLIRLGIQVVGRQGIARHVGTEARETRQAEPEVGGFWQVKKWQGVETPRVLR